MSPERLAQLEEHIRFPSSASLNPEWMLELVAEIKRLAAVPVVVVPVAVRSEAAKVHDAAAAALAENKVVLEGSKPTPPPPHPRKKAVK